MYNLCPDCFSKIQEDWQTVESGVLVQNDPCSLSPFHVPVKSLPDSTCLNDMLQTPASSSLLRFLPNGCTALIISVAFMAH